MSWLPKSRVVVPVDFSDQSISAVETALSLVAGPAALHIIHVLPVIADYEIGMMMTVTDEEARVRHAEQALRERLSDVKFAGFKPHVSLGDPGHEIADFAEEIAAELIIVPSHGRTGITRLLIGSTAERIVRLAHCPVLVLKAPVAK